jgi:hypothetical protein
MVARARGLQSGQSKSTVGALQHTRPVVAFKKV